MKNPITDAAASTGQNKKSSILNPILVMDSIFILPISWVLKYGEGWDKIYAATVLFILLLSTIAAYFIMLFRDPNKLMSEQFQLEYRRMDMRIIGDDRARMKMIDLSAEPTVNNPNSSSEGKEDE